MTPCDRINSLEAQIAQLRGLLLARTEFMPKEWQLTALQQTIMGALLSHSGTVAKEHLIELMYHERNEPEDAGNVLRAMVHGMRRRLARFDITIKIEWGVGYFLDPPGKQIVLRSLSQ